MQTHCQHVCLLDLLVDCIFRIFCVAHTSKRVLRWGSVHVCLLYQAKLVLDLEWQTQMILQEQLC